MSTSSIPAGLLANYPAASPPPGVKSNFIDPPAQKTALLAVNVVFLSLMWFVVAARLYAKARVSRTLGWDDYTCATAAIASTAHSAVVFVALPLGFGRHMWDIRALTLLDVANVRRLESTSIIYPIVIYFVKVSLLLLYLRIFGVFRNVRLLVYGGIGFLTLFYISYLGVQIGFLMECSVFNVCSDIYIFIIPILRITNLQVSKRQKLGVLCIFLAGLVACLVSIARLIFTASTLNRPDKYWYAAMTNELTCTEINLAIIAACMPTLPGFFVCAKLYGSSIYKSIRSHILSSSHSNTSQKGSETSHNYGSLLKGANKSSNGVHELDTIPLQNMA